jgi:hypothetical protein
VDGLPVEDSAGEPFAFPFLGGFDVPRPQLVDEDDDGDLDLFVQELSGEVMFFEQVDDAGDPPFAWRSDRYRDLDVGEWYRFADVDGDGDLDLLAEEPHSYVRYVRNEGTRAEPEFVPVADSLRDADGEPIFSDRQNIPNVGDVDCDGLPDLLVGRLDGTVSRYERVDGTGAGDDDGDGEAPRFRHVTDDWQGIEIVNRLVTRHGANSLTLVDRDDDGDLDLFWGDYFEPGLLYIENTGSCEDPFLRDDPVPFPEDDPLATSGYNAPTVGDVDGDGRLDVLVGVLGGAYNPTRTSADNLYLLEGTEDGVELRARRYLDGIDVGSESSPAVGDLDGDGDGDLLLANKIDPGEGRTSLVYRFENVGAPDEPAFREAGPLEIRGQYQYAPELADLDGDGVADLLLGQFRGRVAYHRGDGSGGFTRADSALVEITRGSHTVPALGDLDGDGDLELMVGESSGTLNYYRNDGSPGSPDFELVSDAFGDIDVGRRSAPALVDLDDDGDLDLVVGSESSGLQVFRNEGDAEAFEFVQAGRLRAAVRGLSSPVFADVEGDGRPELISGSASGGVLLFRRP